MSYEKIAVRIGVSKQTQVRWARLYADELDRMKSEEQSAMVERLALTKKARLTVISELLDSLSLELEKRSFSELTTSALIRHLLQGLSQARSELDPIEIRASVESPLTRWMDIIKVCAIPEVDQNVTMR